MDAWTIVDQLHVARQVVQRLAKDPTSGDLADFLAQFEGATLLRNAMDHLDERTPQRAKTKSTRMPLFGTLKFFKPRSECLQNGVWSEEVRGDFVMLMIGSVPKEEAAGGFKLEGMRVDFPISNLQLEAFDICVDLDLGVWKVSEIVQRFSEQSRVAFAKCKEANPNLSEETANIDLSLVFDIGVFV